MSTPSRGEEPREQWKQIWLLFSSARILSIGIDETTLANSKIVVASEAGNCFEGIDRRARLESNKALSGRRHATRLGLLPIGRWLPAHTALDQSNAQSDRRSRCLEAN
jgi:hypothetical protein